MSTLAEIEAAADALPPEQQAELFSFLAARLHPAEEPPQGAKLVEGPRGILLLEAPSDAPPMTAEAVKRLLADFP